MIEQSIADQAMDMTGAKPLEPTIPLDLVVRVARRPRTFSEAVLALANIDRTAEARRTPDELARMQLCRDALCGLVAQRQQYTQDMVHNATSGVKPAKTPYFAS